MGRTERDKSLASMIERRGNIRQKSKNWTPATDEELQPGPFLWNSSARVANNGKMGKYIKREAAKVVARILSVAALGGEGGWPTL